MHAVTEIDVTLDRDGRPVLRRMQCEAPLLVRDVRGTGRVLSLFLVGGAAGPIGGDRLRFTLSVGAGCHVVVRSVAASLVQPGPRGDRSETDLDVTVADGAVLDWAPEPTVSVHGSHHRTRLRLMVGGSGAVRFAERVSLGRLGEGSGRLAIRQRVEIAGRPVLDHETEFGPGALAGPGAHGSARSVASTVVVGDELPAPRSSVSAGSAVAVMHVDPRCALVTALG